MKRLMLLLFLFGYAGTAHAQAVINPSSATFAHSDTDYSITATYHVDFYACQSVSTAGVCTGQSAAPFNAGLDVAKSAVTGTAAARVIDLKSATAQGVLTSIPIGTGIVATIKAVGDTSIPGVAGTSQASAPSDGFFAQARIPAAPGKPVAK